MVLRLVLLAERDEHLAKMVVDTEDVRLGGIGTLEVGQRFSAADERYGTTTVCTAVAAPAPQAFTPRTLRW